MTTLAIIEATDLGDAWFQVIYNILTKGRQYEITKGSFEGIDRFGVPFLAKIKFPGSRPLAPIMPEGSSIPPPTNEDGIQQYMLYLMGSERQPNEHYTYGEDLHWLIEWVISHYKKFGYGTNHGYMTVGRPETVHFYDRDINYYENITVSDRVTGKILRNRAISNDWNEDKEVETSSQCLRGIDTWIDEEKLHFWCYFRSWDVWGGFPVNLGGIQLVKEYMASEIGVEDGEMIVTCKDIHIYEHTLPVALQRINKEKFWQAIGGEKNAM